MALPFGAIATGVGAVSNLISGIGAEKRQMRRQKEMADYNYDLNERSAQNAYRRQQEAWNLQNSYNTPANQRRLLEEAGLSVGMMYGQGAPAEAGSLSSVPAGSGGSGMSAPDMSNFINARSSAVNSLMTSASLAKLQSEVQVNESVAERNRAEAGLAPDRKDLMSTQSELNTMLGLNANARTAGELIANSLSEATLPHDVRAAEQLVSMNAMRLRQWTVDLQKSGLELQFNKATFDDRVQLAVNQQRELAARMALQYVQIEAMRKGMLLTDAQIDQLRAHINTEFELQGYLGSQAEGKRLDTAIRSNTAPYEISSAKSGARLRQSESMWFNPNQLMNAVDKVANTALINFSSATSLIK